MAVRPLAQLGNPVLRQPAEPLQPVPGPEADALIADLYETLRDFRARQGYGRALSAPIIGVPRRAFIVLIEEQALDLALINPTFVNWSREHASAFESCLTFPLWGVVSRPQRVVISALDRTGATQTIEADGLLARVLQHEMDHLDGLIFLDREPDLHSLCTREEYKLRHQGG
jgi:peptide deformylase